MGLVRAIGWVLLFPAILVLSYGIVAHINGVPVFDVSAADYLAGRVTPELDFVQQAARRHIPGALADPRTLAILHYPLAEALAIFAGILAVPGVVLLVLFRRGWSGALIRREYMRKAAPARHR